MSDIPDASENLAVKTKNSFGFEQYILSEPWFLFFEALNQSSSTTQTTQQTLSNTNSAINTGFEAEMDSLRKEVKALKSQIIANPNYSEIDELKREVKELRQLIYIALHREPERKEDQTWRSSLGNLQA